MTEVSGKEASSDFELILFSTDPPFIHRAVAAGVSGILVDWEYVGKEDRQRDADTQINRHTVDDLRRVRACTEAPIICRINGYGTTTEEEIEHAIQEGADELLLPMVRTLKEVEAVLDWVADRCGVGVMIETLAAVGLAQELARLPLTRVYVGLQDLAIERDSPNLFTAIADGTLERIRGPFSAPFGFGGVTLPELGYPVPSWLLIGEMSRLGCDFTVLRRSFHRDIRGRELTVEIPRLLKAFRQADLRSPRSVAREREELEAAIRAWPIGVGAVGKSPTDG